MLNLKPWFQSKTIQASALVVLLPILSYFGIKMGAEDLQSSISLITSAVTSLAGVVAIYGRVTATTKIT
jgi:hypothetical protein